MPTIDVLVRYGPLAFWDRVVDGDGYEERVQQLMAQHSSMSRRSAEAEVNDAASECSSFWRGEERPRVDVCREEDAVGAGERLATFAWLVVLVASTCHLAVSMSVSLPEYEAAKAAADAAAEAQRLQLLFD